VVDEAAGKLGRIGAWQEIGERVFTRRYRFLDQEIGAILTADGPVIIDLPQAVDAAGNNHAQRMLLRDVANLSSFFGRFAQELLTMQFGPELWELYTRGVLLPTTRLTGRFHRVLQAVDVEGVLRVVDDARAEEKARLLRLQTAT